MNKNERRRKIDRLENALIVLLVCTALVLIGQSELFRGAAGAGSGTGAQTVFTGVQDTALSRGLPARLVVQTSQGRYGVQYDRPRTVGLYRDDGLQELLLQAVDDMSAAKSSTKEDWQEALSQTGSWVYYDFLYNISFTSRNDEEEGEGRRFLITTRSGRADRLYYYNDETKDYYVSQLRDNLSLPASLLGLPDNGARFAFEVPEVASLLAPDMLLLNETPYCPVYRVSNPWQQLDEAGRQALASALDFNLRAAAVYEAADGTVIQEGADTLRLQKNGKLTFHAAESGQARYQALSAREKDLQIKAEEILNGLAGDWMGDGRMCCQSIETLEDGTVALTFCYLLNNTPVQLWGEGWSAQFLFEGREVTSFFLYLRQYTLADRSQQVLPERQAAAAADALGQTGKELQLCYPDDGTATELAAEWIVREET